MSLPTIQSQSGKMAQPHEPVEHLAGLRAMPNLNVFRPADARETQAVWYLAVTSENTNCPCLDTSKLDC